MNSILPIFIIFVPAVLYAFGNVWESRAMNGIFKSVPATFFYASFSVMIFSIPILLMTGQLKAIPFEVFALVAIEASFGAATMVIFYHAIKIIYISVSQALFGAGAAVIPFLGMWIFGEYMNTASMLGFFIITISGILASIDNLSRPKLNRGFFLMILVVIFFYAHLLIEKEIVSRVGWANSAFYHELMFMIFIIMMLAVPKIKESVRENFEAYRNNLIPFLVYGLFGAIAMMSEHYVLGEVPIALKEGVAGTQPFFVLMFAWVLAKVGLGGAREGLSRRAVVKKVFFFAIMFAGLVMLLT